MPELPEVQCFVNDLNAEYQNCRVQRLILRRAGLRYPFDKKNLERIFASGVMWKSARRVGKQIEVETDVGIVHISLGMTGSFCPSLLKSPILHEHLSVEFADGRVLGFVDPRRFGFWMVGPVGEAERSSADPLSEKALQKLFRQPSTRKSSRPIKALLLDQEAIGGIGNIYAVEALFRAHIHPERVCSALRSDEWNTLAKAIPPLLSEAIRLGGSSVATYRRLAGAAGSFQTLHLVYDRESENCSRQLCRGTIRRIVQNGRSSWFCDHCQRQ